MATTDGTTVTTYLLGEDGASVVQVKLRNVCDMSSCLLGTDLQASIGNTEGENS